MRHTYSDNVHNLSIALLGPLPPPLGGVSVHIERVIAKLKKQNNKVNHFDTTKEMRYRFFGIYLIKLFYFLFIHRPQLLIYHTTYLSNAISELRFIIFLRKIFRFKLILIEHDCRFAYHLSDVQKKTYQHILAHTDHQVCIGTRTLESFTQNNLLCKQLTLESAFLPPDVSRRQELLKAYPSGLFTFMEQHSPILLANAFQLSLLNGKDLYGFDQLVEAFACYTKESSNAGLILMLAQKGDEQLYAHLLSHIAAKKLNENVFIVIGNRVLWPLFAYVDLFVRPTLSDGASVSIEEALYFNIPVVASDVCWRPSDCKLYVTGDYSKLYLTISQTFE